MAVDFFYREVGTWRYYCPGGHLVVNLTKSGAQGECKWYRDSGELWAVAKATGDVVIGDVVIYDDEQKTIPTTTQEYTNELQKLKLGRSLLRFPK